MTNGTGFLASVLLCGFVVLSSGASGLTIAKGDRTATVTKAEATFLATGRPGFLRINGTGGVPTGTFTYKGGMLSGVVECPMEAFVTGIGMRDTHMKEKYLEVGKFPKAIAELEAVAVDPSRGSWTDVPFRAWLTLHGVRKQVSGVFTAKPDTDHSAEVEAAFDLKISEFGISLPSYAGITMAEDVKVSVHFHAVSAAPERAGVK